MQLSEELALQSVELSENLVEKQNDIALFEKRMEYYEVARTINSTAVYGSSEYIEEDDWATNMISAWIMYSGYDYISNDDIRMVLNKTSDDDYWQYRTILSLNLSEEITRVLNLVLESEFYFSEEESDLIDTYFLRYYQWLEASYVEVTNSSIGYDKTYEEIANDLAFAKDQYGSDVKDIIYSRLTLE